MKVGPKYKICKRLGSSVFEKCQTQRYQLSEARSAKNRGRGGRRALSDFGRQLLEKQRARFTYGVTENQLSRYAKNIAPKSETKPTEQFINNLEFRLDNVVYRAGLAPTRRMARQLVSHGHIVVNGKRFTIPSHRMEIGDTFGVREESKQKGPFAELSENMADHATPGWISFDAKKYSGSITGAPAGETEPAFDASLVLEFYSR